MTELEAMRLYLTEDWFTYPMFLARLRGTDEENDAMRAGSAFHEFLEHAQAGDVVSEFTRDGMRFVLDIKEDLAIPRVRECKTELGFVVDGMQVTLVGKADTVEGRIIGDYKLSAAFDAEKYTDSLQWRAYLMMFDAVKFTYWVFSNKRKGDTITVTSLDEMSFYRYEGLEQEVRTAVVELARFIVQHVPERITAGDEKLLNF